MVNHPKDVPFFGNTRDNTHCYQATIRMVLKYFLPKKNFTWKELERMSAKKEGKWTWPTQMLINLQKMGFDLVVIDEFDFDKFIEKGEKFFFEIWSKEMAEAQIKNSDIKQERRLFKEYKKHIEVKKRKATLRDISNLLKKGYLVEAGVNSIALNGKKGYAGHSVLIYKIDAKNVYLHDPGLPPLPSRKISRNVFKKAFNDSAAIAGLRF